MRQVTGSNPKPSANKVSIQLALDGHSFSAEWLEMADGLKETTTAERSNEAQESVEVELLSARTMLLPEELFDASLCTQALVAAGLPPQSGERVVYSDSTAGAVALIAASDEALHAVRERLGEHVHFTTPLLRVVANATQTVWMHRTASLLYIKVYTDGELRLAEVLPTIDDAELLYLIERLGVLYPLRRMQLRLSGRDSKVTRKLIRKSFKQVVCES